MLAAAPISPLPNNNILAGSGTVPVGFIWTSSVERANPVFGLLASNGAIWTAKSLIWFALVNPPGVVVWTKNDTEFVFDALACAVLWLEATLSAKLPKPSKLCALRSAEKILAELMVSIVMPVNPFWVLNPTPWPWMTKFGLVETVTRMLLPLRVVVTVPRFPTWPKLLMLKT